MDFNANISISETDFDTYVGDLIDSRFDLDDLASKVVENLDTSDIVSQVEEQIDIDRIIQDVIDQIDINDIANDIRSDIRDEGYVQEDDIEGLARDLLSSYTPGNHCSTGNAFTEAISRGLFYMIKENYDGIREHLVRYLFADVFNTYLDIAMKEARPKIIAEYLEAKALKEKEEQERIESARLSQLFTNHGV